MTKYFTSDWHLNEKRIGKSLNLFFRPFESVEEQNRTILDNLNKVVKENDELYVLGDVCMDLEAVDLLKQINCKNRVLIIGNYDEDKLYDDIQSGACEMCGSGPLITTMKACRALGATKSKVLLYRNSGDVTGDRNQVVGYKSGMFYK